MRGALHARCGDEPQDTGKRLERGGQEMGRSLGFAHRLLRLGSTIVLLFILLVTAGNVCSACTIVVKADQRTIFVGSNEDYLEPRTKVWFFPAGGRDHGRVIWGYDRALWPYQGGMNDQGLFVDVNAIGYTGFKNDPQKPGLPSDEIEYFLAKCATAEEVIRVFHQYDIDMGYVKYVFADAEGNSVIIEWLGDKLNVLRREGDHQVSTNFTSPLEHTEPRNQISQRILSSQEEPTLDLIRRALSASAFAAPFCQTLYSTICDLRQKRIFLYHFHNFEECVTFDLGEELSKGEAEYTIPSLFAVRPHSENLWLGGGGSQLGAKSLVEFMQANGAEKGVARFHEMAEEVKKYHRYVFEEWIIRDAGMVLKSRGMIQEAIAIFELNSQQFPESWEAYYDLAGAYAELGDREAAQHNYRLALEHGPDAGRIDSIRSKLEAMRE